MIEIAIGVAGLLLLIYVCAVIFGAAERLYEERFLTDEKCSKAGCSSAGAVYCGLGMCALHCTFYSHDACAQRQFDMRKRRKR